VPPRLLAQSFS